MASICVVLVVPSVVSAGPILRSGETISVDASQVLKGDFYGLSPNVTISGPAEDDVYIAGGTVTINAPVAKDLTIVGGSVQIHGEIGDDVRIVGGEVTLAKAVKGDVVVMGGSLTVLSTATVEGDVLFMGGTLVVEGEVAGAIHGAADTVRINTKVGGNITMNVARLFSLGDNSEILGTITYESANDIVRAQNSIVGEVQKLEPKIEQGVSLLKKLAFVVGMLLFAALTCYLALRKYIEPVMVVTSQTPGMSGLVGLSVFLLLPFIASLLVVSVLGSIIGIFLFMLYGVSLILALLGACVLLGLYLQKVLTKKSSITMQTVVSGVLLFCLIGFVPVLGGFIAFGLMCIVLGGMSTSFYRALRS